MQELKRSDEKYIEIENFKDYELTPCIAYEMAIRNDEFISTAREAVEFYRENNDLIDYYLSNDKSTLDDFDSIEDAMSYNIKSSEAYNHIIDLLSNIRLYSNEEGPLIHEKITLFDGRLLYILNSIKVSDIEAEKLIFRGKTNKHEIYCSYVDVLEAYKVKQVINRQEPGFYIQNTLFFSEEAFGCDDKDGNFIPNPENIDDLRKRQEDVWFYSFESTTNISPYFNRPILYSDPLKRKKVTLPIDMSLPVDELVAFVKHAKKYIDEDPEIVAAPIELLGESLEAADYEVCMNKGNCFDTRKYLSKQHKIANMFFIYDATKAGLKAQQIINELFRYEIDQADNASNITPMDRKTLKKYLHIATEYIDNGRYKELIDGVKS